MPRGIAGYTLLEISIAVSMVTVLGLISGTVMIRGLQVVGTQAAYADVSEALRTAALTLNNELGDAVLEAVPGSSVLKGLVLDPASPGVIAFQRPLALDGLKASPQIQLRVRNEDANGNLQLDDGEDKDKSRTLDRVLERLEDLNGDGLYDQPGEVRVLARNIDAIQFSLDPGSRQIRATVAARKAITIAGKPRIVEKSHDISVFVRN